jgi:hypothetical protein
VGGGGCGALQLRVVDLQNGRSSRWLLPSDTADAYADWFISQLSWSPDERRLALHYGRCCADGSAVWVLDRTDRGGDLRRAAKRVAKTDCIDPPFAWTDAGIVAVGGDCGLLVTRLIAIDATAGDIRPLSSTALPDPFDSIDADITGEHLLLYVGGDVATVMRADHGVVTKVGHVPWDADTDPSPVW